MSSESMLAAKVPPERILVVDDEPNMAWLFAQAFAGDCEVLSANSGEKALEMLKPGDVDLVLLDLRLPGMDGITTLKAAREQGYSGPVIMMTAYGDVKTAVEAMKLGAHDYITKPFDIDELKLVVQGALRFSRLSREVVRLRQEIEEKFHLGNIVTVSPKMMEIFSIVERVSSSDVSVLIQGESGTGKELIARAIHYSSPRRTRDFVPVNCAALPENLLESELFGYEEGAFSGAKRRKPGKFELASGGTLFLDEVGDLPISMQPKILRAIEEKVIERLGGTQRVPVDVRVVAATNRDLRKEVLEERFRKDLYYRLAVICITVPPLRERPEDIPVLAKHFLKECCTKAGKLVPVLDDGAIASLVSYHWPGNVRELKNVMQQVGLLCDGSVIRKGDLPILFPRQMGYPMVTGFVQTASPVFGADQCQDTPAEIPLKELRTRSWSDIERQQIADALRRFNGNRTKAAAYLGISRRSLLDKIKKYGL